MAPNIATNTRVSLDELLDFVRPRHHAILLTRRADGGPQGSPLTCGVDDSGRIVVSTYPERAKTRNAKRDPRVSLIVLSDDWNGPWVQIDGTAEVIDPPDSVEPLVEYYRNIAGEHPDWDEYRAAMLKQGKSIIRVTPERWGPVATGHEQRPVLPRERPHLVAPVLVGVRIRQPHLAHDLVQREFEEVVLGVDVPVDGHRGDAQLTRQPPHRELGQPLGVQQPDGDLDDARAVQARGLPTAATPVRFAFQPDAGPRLTLPSRFRHGAPSSTC
ncbi:hypothetical protein SVIOM74S_07633 [Streptomyces violarus]